jgi:hypothetical protein
LPAGTPQQGFDPTQGEPPTQVGVRRRGKHSQRVAACKVGPERSEGGWVDREHHIASRQQRLHPRPAVGFDAHLDLVWLDRWVKMLRGQLMQGRHPSQPLRQSTARQHPARFVFDFDVMVGFSPVVANKQHRGPHSRI